ncbi:LysR family transcriptional regulator [Azospirillum canadense]|uniref:LysR family transcriptional regulator n=1 Tax=Azospirillum canadense TaxID=403962 RepID=UPI0022280384|nr:LysR substrate-binding domain-containing protein [Azospirillum canadense]MCW2241807.1 LysR family nitrogen assimilation transcriptional regulator [Azospirillum canadense]
MALKANTSFDLKQLAYFVAIADQGTISRAAAQLGIAQPSLSEALTRFEKQLGTTLVIRSVRGIELTEAGFALAEHGRSILTAIEQALEDVQQRDREVRGTISVALTPSLSRLLTVPLAESIYAEFPHLKLQITEGNSGHISDWVQSDQTDLGVIYEGLDLTPFSARLLLREELYLISAPDNWPPPVADAAEPGQPVDFATLERLPMMLPNRPHGLRALIDREAKAANVQLNAVLEIDPLRHLITMVDRASGYTILPHAAVADEVAQGSVILVRIRNPTLWRAAYLIRRHGRSVTRAIIAVETIIEKLVADAADRLSLHVPPQGGS